VYFLSVCRIIVGLSKEFCNVNFYALLLKPEVREAINLHILFYKVFVILKDKLYSFI